MTDGQLPGTADTDKDPKMPTAAEKRAAAKKAADKPKTTRKRRGGKVDIAQKVAETMSLAGAGFVAAGVSRGSEQLLFDGRLIIANADKTGQALAELAAEDPKIKAALERAFTTSSYAKVAMVLAGTAIPIAACHGLAPQSIGQTLVPDGMVVPSPPAPKKPAAPKPPQQPPTERTYDPTDGDAETGMGIVGGLNIPAPAPVSAAGGLPDVS